MGHIMARVQSRYWIMQNRHHCWKCYRKGDEYNFPEHEIQNMMSVSHYRTFKHCQSIVKHSPNGFSDVSSSAVLPASITSSLINLIHSSLINLESLKYFKNSQLKLLNFQTLSHTAWTDINNRLLIDNWRYFKLLWHCSSVCLPFFIIVMYF